MSTSAGTTGGASRRDRDKDSYEPEQQSVRNIAARDGYDAGDGFQRPNPLLWSNASSASQSSYLPNASSSYNNRGARRRSSTGAFEDNDDYYRRRGQRDPYAHGREYTIPRRNRSVPRARDYMPDHDSDSESDWDEDDERGRALAKRRASSRGRSQSGIRQRLQDMFSSDESEMGRGNSEAKKWAATVAGAVAGGFAARTAKKDHWVPTALGAFIGGFTAREAEKAFYLHKDAKEREQQAWESQRGKD